MLFVIISACIVLLYWLLEPAKREWFLLCASISMVFYWDSLSMYWIATCSLLCFAVCTYAKTYTKWLILLLVGQLLFAKYHFAMVPLGLSFSSFCLLHYSIEVSRGKFHHTSWRDFLGYVFFFPIFTAGPIANFQNFTETKSHRPDLVNGLSLVAIGVVKKWLIADVWIAQYLQGWDGEMLVTYGMSTSVANLWLILWASFAKLYFDFSGYSDIAIGGGKLFGYSIEDNFHFPLFSTNIADFWKRWHITLGNWCQRYIYMPLLGYTRNTQISMIVTFMLMGIWHDLSWHWFAWGVWHGLGLVIHAKWRRWSKDFAWTEHWMVHTLSVCLTICFVSVTGVFTLLAGVGSITQSLHLLLHAFGLR